MFRNVSPLLNAPSCPVKSLSRVVPCEHQQLILRRFHISPSSSTAATTCIVNRRRHRPLLTTATFVYSFNQRGFSSKCCAVDPNHYMGSNGGSLVVVQRRMRSAASALNDSSSNYNNILGDIDRGNNHGSGLTPLDIGGGMKMEAIDVNVATPNISSISKFISESANMMLSDASSSAPSVIQNGKLRDFDGVISLRRAKILLKRGVKNDDPDDMANGIRIMAKCGGNLDVNDGVLLIRGLMHHQRLDDAVCTQSLLSMAIPSTNKGLAAFASADHLCDRTEYIWEDDGGSNPRVVACVREVVLSCLENGQVDVARNILSKARLNPLMGNELLASVVSFSFYLPASTLQSHDVVKIIIDTVLSMKTVPIQFRPRIINTLAFLPIILATRSEPSAEGMAPVFGLLRHVISMLWVSGDGAVWPPAHVCGDSPDIDLEDQGWPILLPDSINAIFFRKYFELILEHVAPTPCFHFTHLPLPGPGRLLFSSEFDSADNASRHPCNENNEHGTTPRTSANTARLRYLFNMLANLLLAERRDIRRVVIMVVLASYRQTQLPRKGEGDVVTAGASIRRPPHIQETEGILDYRYLPDLLAAFTTAGLQLENWHMNVALHMYARYDPLVCVRMMEASDARTIANIPQNVLRNMIAGLRRFGEKDCMWRVMQILQDAGVNPSIHVHNVILNDLARGDNTERVYEMLEALEKRGPQPDIISYCSVANHILKTRKYELFDPLVHRLKDLRVKPGIVLFRQMLVLAPVARDWDYVLRVRQDVKRLRLEKDYIYFAALMECCYFFDRLHLPYNRDACVETKETGYVALEEWDSIRRSRVYPNIHALELLVKVLAVRGLHERICEVREALPRFRISPRDSIYLGLIEAYGIAGDIDGVHRTIDDMISDNLIPTSEHINMVLFHLGRLRASQTTLLSTCRLFSEHCVSPTSDTHQILMNECGLTGSSAQTILGSIDTNLGGSLNR